MGVRVEKGAACALVLVISMQSVYHICIGTKPRVLVPTGDPCIAVTLMVSWLLGDCNLHLKHSVNMGAGSEASRAGGREFGFCSDVFQEEVAQVGAREGKREGVREGEEERALCILHACV